MPAVSAARWISRSGDIVGTEDTEFFFDVFPEALVKS